MMNRREFSKSVGGLLALVGIGSKANAEPLTGPIATADVLTDEYGVPENHFVWTTADGRRVRVVDMTDDHLRNCIMYINRVYTKMVEMKTGHIPMNQPLEIPSYAIMLREAQRRKLSWMA